MDHAIIIVQLLNVVENVSKDDNKYLWPSKVLPPPPISGKLIIDISSNRARFHDFPVIGAEFRVPCFISERLYRRRFRTFDMEIDSPGRAISRIL